eukprot:TRINITY_DN29635_c0_g2_i4.p3 TRINITY_DN29635_c0_g2~~TRINITY_DN29635_c0_g2_i4.p3  ORF type:complete len:112 (-),score=13.97 TRINITY_DN29635_c0_g2_i4:192-527(-)
MGSSTGLTTPQWGGLVSHKRQNILIQIPDFEVLVAISNYNLVKWGGMLNVFIETIQRVGIKNYIIVAIDKELYEFLLKKGVNVWYKDVTISESQKDTGSNHAVSALKFGIL